MELKECLVRHRSTAIYLIAFFSNRIASFVENDFTNRSFSRDCGTSQDNCSLPLSVSKTYLCSRRKVLRLACFEVFLGRLLLVDLIVLEYPVTLFHVKIDLVNYPPNGEGPLLILGMSTLFN